MVLAAGAVVWWHGLAVQDARPLASKGFRPPFGLGRVTLERPALFKKCTKGLLPRQSDRYAVALGSGARSAGTTQTALWPSPSMASAKVRFEHPCSRAKSGRAMLALARFCPCAGCVCAIIPDGAPDLAPSPRRIGGGSQYRAYSWSLARRFNSQ